MYGAAGGGSALVSWYRWRRSLARASASLSSAQSENATVSRVRWVRAMQQKKGQQRERARTAVERVRLALIEEARLTEQMDAKFGVDHVVHAQLRRC